MGVTILLAYFNLVFGELVPKRIALQKAETFSLFCVRPIYMISRVMNPFIRLLSLSTSGFLKLIGMHSESLEAEVSEEEIKSMPVSYTHLGMKMLRRWGMGLLRQGAEGSLRLGMARPARPLRCL